MTILIELDPETEARLAAEANRRGIAPEQLAGQFLRDNLPMYGTGTGILSPEDVDEMSERLSEGSENMPVLPPEVNDRASYYEDRW